MYETCSDLICKFRRPLSADEVLADKINHLVPVPLPSAEEISAIIRKGSGKEEEQLPRIDLMVVHYFLAQLVIQKYPRLINCFDETSLIAIGIILEEWVEEYFQTESPDVFDGAALAITKNTDYTEFPSNI